MIDTLRNLLGFARRPDKASLEHPPAGTGRITFDARTLDLIATARAFLGTPYLWGGTSGHGIDCSGFVQQVYRLNGVGLGRDADQQALEGRAANTPNAGDLLFFGSPTVTHVAMSLGGDDFIHAPMRSGFVEERKIGADRVPVAIRRYLLEIECATSG